MSTLESLFGAGKDLTVVQMTLRAIVLFFITLVLVRIGGMRAFGRKSSFDTIIVIMLGAVLSRAVVGVSPFAPTVAAAAALVVIHRLLGMATARSKLLEKLVKGEHHEVYRDGHVDRRAMVRAGISEGDLDEAVRASVHASSRRDVSQIELESDGQLTVIERQ
jgi:uncharacterized membrane protein YcaP (DUF421 family)